MTIKPSLSSSTAAPKAATTGGVASYSYRALQAQNDSHLSHYHYPTPTSTSTSHSNNDALNTTTPHLRKNTSQQSIEAELSKILQISWIDARDLASFARGKLNIIPGDKSQEQTRRQSVLRVAIEADKAAPRKRVLSKPKNKKKLTKEEETIQRLKKAENNALIRWDLRESRWGWGGRYPGSLAW